MGSNQSVAEGGNRSYAANYEFKCRFGHWVLLILAFVTFNILAETVRKNFTLLIFGLIVKMLLINLPNSIVKP